MTPCVHRTSLPLGRCPQLYAYTGIPMKVAFIALLSVLLLGCVSTHMKQYLGKDIREVVLDSGPPLNAMDMEGGVRAFQFRWGGGTYRVPTTTTTTGSVSTSGNSAWFNSTSITSGGGVVHSRGCLISYLTEWDDVRETWIVRDIRYPKRLVC